MGFKPVTSRSGDMGSTPPPAKKREDNLQTFIAQSLIVYSYFEFLSYSIKPCFTLLATVFNNANEQINVYGDDVEVDYRGYEVRQFLIK